MIWRKLLRTALWSALAVFLLLLSLLAMVSAIVVTEPGSRWFLSQAEKYLPLELGEVKGNLLTGLDLSYVDYRIEENGQLQQRYRAENVSFRWQPLALLYSAVSVQSLSADSINALLPPIADAEPLPAPWPTLMLPVRIELGHVQLDDIQVRRIQLNQPPQSIVSLKRVSGSVSLGTFNLRLTDVAVVADDYSVIVGGRAGLRYPYSARFDVQWQFALPETDARPQPELYSGRAEAEGDIEQLEIAHRLVSPLEIESHISFTPNLSQPPGPIAQVATPYADITSEWPAQALLQNWFPEGAAIPVVGGRLHAQGWLDEYQAELAAEVNYADIPPVTLGARTRGDLKHIDIDELIVQLQDAKDAADSATRASVAGAVAWTPALNWNLAVKAADLDPSRYLAEWPGRLQLQFNTRGGIDAAGLRVQIEQLNLHGQLRAFEVHAEGDARFDGERWQSEEFLLALGANHLRLHGTVGEQFDLQWRLDAPLLTQLDTQLEGSLFTNGTLSGTRNDPQFSLEVRADQLRYQGYALRELRAAVKPEAGAGYRLTLNAQDLAMQQQRIDEIVFDGSGSIAAHRIQGHIESEQYGRVELALNSGYSNEQWQGQFTQLDLRLPGIPRWWLLSSAPMTAATTAGAQTFELGNLCLTTRTAWSSREENTGTDQDASQATSGAAQQLLAELPITQTIDEGQETAAFCSAGRWSSAAGVQLQGTLESIPLRQLRSLLKSDVALTGFIEGDFSLNMPTGKAPVAQANLHTRDGELHYQYLDLPVEVYRWQSLVLTANWQDQLMRANLATDWAQFGNAQADISLNTENQQLAGKVQVNFGDLAPLAAFLPFADELSGQLAGDLQLRGSVQQPQLSGQITLAQGAARMPRLGLELRELGATLRSYENGRIELRSSVRSGEGQLTLTGDLEDFGTPEWQLLATVRGEKFQILEQPELKAQISPAIDVRANQQEIRVSGDALVPSASADIKSLPPTAIRVSEDVVIEDEERINGRDGEIAFYLNVNAQLGDDVRFNGFGLSSRLAGKMSLIQTPTRPLLATGYVDVVDGRYSAYGQELTIERGRLIFQGPYDNPGLDIRAQRSLRNNEDHIVGLEIGGTLQRPTSKVYSDPPLQNEGEAMALLLTGKPLSEASAGDAYAIVSAMSGMGMDKGGSITGQIADAFSLDEFRLSAEDGLEHSSLWVGKYLTDRLFVRYIVGLFDQLNKVKLTYQMTDRLRVEGESGQVQSVDMIYKIER